MELHGEPLSAQLPPRPPPWQEPSRVPLARPLLNQDQHCSAGSSSGSIDNNGSRRGSTGSLNVAQGNGARGLPSQPPATAPSLPAASDPLATRHPAVNTRNAQSPQDNLEAGHGPSPTAPSHVSKRFWCSRMGKGMILATIAAAAFFAGYVTRDELVKAENAKILTRLDALQAQCDSTVTKVETLKESTDSHINSINTKMMTLDQRGSVFEKKLNQTDNTLELVKTDITNIQGDFKVRSDSMTATFSVAGFSNAVLADVETSGESIKVVGNLCLILQKGFYSIRHSHLKDDKTQTGLCIRVGS